MNIRYQGASELTGGKRFAVIQHSKEEENIAERFILLAGTCGLAEDIAAEEECVYIKVEDRDDYAYIAGSFQKYKRVLVNKDLQLAKLLDNSIFSEAHYYEKCETDGEMYRILVQAGYNEETIKKTFEDVSSGPDAYPNALIQVAEEIF